MCGRYTLVQTGGLASRFDTQNELKELRPNYNASPGQAMPVVTRNSPNILQIMQWGLVPSWAKDPKIGYKMINARAETVAEKPSFRSALKRRRCLVPATGFYEWKRQGNLKQPMYIRVEDQEIVALAGLYEHWQDPEGNELMSYTIITTTPNSLMESIHDRMPVILPREAEDQWLDSSLDDPLKLLPLLIPYSAKQMAAHPVSVEVNSPRNNAPSLLLPVEEQSPIQGEANSK